MRSRRIDLVSRENVWRQFHVLLSSTDAQVVVVVAALVLFVDVDRCERRAQSGNIATP